MRSSIYNKWKNLFHKIKSVMVSSNALFARENEIYSGQEPLFKFRYMSWKVILRLTKYRIANVGQKLRLEKRSLRMECKGCLKYCPTAFAYDQHRRSPALRNKACQCGSRTEENRKNVTAVQRANMSTAAVERRPAQLRCRGKSSP